ncbi:MAG: hypothetical protein SFV19_20810 [Rhodospirillaceae bacterium]|nr:hypothetical protein [Rhodospirillaceae bacterium]
MRARLALVAAALTVSMPLLAVAQGVPQIPPPPPKGPMTFFLTSAGPGDGANLGGLAGADAHCQKLAEAVGAGGFVWRAYLSTQAEGGKPAVNARDRIGTGPWHNAIGNRIARDLSHLHGDTVADGREGNLVNQATALTEKGEVVPGEFNKPNQHDILTGSQVDGTAYADALDHTCKNWTSNGADGSAQVGHHDRQSRITSASWNSAHPSRGCSQQNLISTGGAGQFYCFAAAAK